MIYLDGSALCRFLPGVRHHAEWGAWATSRVAEFVTSQLGFTELRQAADLYPRRSMDRVLEIVETVRAGVGVIRFSDNDVTISSHATAVLKPFAALHLGAAVGHDGVDTIATYDPTLASVARMYDLVVVSPGLPDDWFLQYEGPPEEWKPVALDAPYEPGAEYDLPEASPKKDMYDEALEEAKAAAAAGPIAPDEVAEEPEDETDAAESEAESEAVSPDEPLDGEDDSDDLGSAVDDQDAAADDSVADDDKPADEAEAAEDEPAGDDKPSDDKSADEELSEFDRALREAEAAALANGATDDDGDDDEEDDEDDDLAAHTGTYRPKIEAWRGSVDEGEDPSIEPSDDEESGDGLPWSSLPEPPAPAPGASPKPPTPTPPTPTPTPPIPPSASTPGPTPPSAAGASAALDPSEEDLSAPPPALAPPDPEEAVAIPTIPREERGVPPVAPPRSTDDAPARRPMFDTDPHPDSRASRPPEPVPDTPPEESQPLTVPIKWNVELDEPESLAPKRPETPFPVPSQPVTQEVRPGGLTLEAPNPDSVPNLEPPSVSAAAPAVPPPPGVVAPPPVEHESRAAQEKTPSSRERKAREKAAKKERERREKAAKKKAPAKPSTPPAPKPESAPAPAKSPEPAAADDGASWKIEDVIDLGKGKRRK